ncbi:MAG: hypothetical protein ACREXU_21010, partial [Gammaproteobacteria bacterium]
MKRIDRVIKRLRKDRPMLAVTLRMPVDVLEDLKRIAPMLGHGGYQPLMRAYVGRGLREDLARLEGSDLQSLVACLRRRGVDEAVLAQAIAETSGGG